MSQKSIITFIMDIRASLLQEHSKAMTLRLTEYVGGSQQRFDILMDLFLNDEYRVVQRSGWVVSSVAEKYPKLIMPYLKECIAYLENPPHDAVKRNILKVLSAMDIPEEHQGTLVDRCFKFLYDPKEPIAVHAFAMQVIFEIGKKEPDLFYELKQILEENFETGSAGYKVRAKRILKHIYQNQ